MMYDVDGPALDERVAKLVEPDAILPSQFLAENSRDTRCPGERRLMAAVLEDAVRVYQQDAGARNRRRQRLFREVEQWFESPDKSWPYSFERICEILRLDPDYLRCGLRAWKKRALRGPQALVIPLRSGHVDVETRRASGE